MIELFLWAALAVIALYGLAVILIGSISLSQTIPDLPRRFLDWSPFGAVALEAVDG